jgi:hypothetical protein
MLSRRLADISGPFFDPTKPLRNWSAFPFAQIDLDEPPFVNQGQLAWGLTRAKRHLHALHAQGYSGIVCDNLAHLVAFDSPGAPIYAPDSPARLRALAYRAAFAELFDLAVALNMEVLVTSDMQWSTPELRRAVGSLTPENPHLAALNRRAVAELFTTLPQVRGLVVRVGEAGGAHDQGDAYAGHMLYTTVAALRGLIQTLLPVCETHRRELIMRTWGLGIGELGDVNWSPERYTATFGDLRSPNLLVSIKHGPADFFRMLPPNPTLGLAGPRQIVELQNRREYELFGLVPSSVAALHGAALARASADPQCSGLWAWNSTGGWGGGQASLGADGWNLWTELSSALTVALATNPDLAGPAFAHAWLAVRFPDSPAFAAAAAALYNDSAAQIEHGWYMGPLPRAVPHLGGVCLAPLLWVWWMRPTAALPIWAYLADAVGDHARVLRASRIACTDARTHAQRLAELAPDSSTAHFVVTSARYLADALELALATRTLMLSLMSSARHGNAPNVRQLRTAAAAAQAAIAAHYATWNGRSDFPALELDEVAQFAATLANHPRTTWLKARAAWAGVAALRRRLRHNTGRTRARRSLIAPLQRRALHATLPWLSRRLNLLPTIFFETGPALREWAA